jgi:hypothetical protein
VLFKAAFAQGVVGGSITLTFRAWSRPQARAGSRQRLGLYDATRGALGFLEIDRVERVPVASIATAQARRAGFASVDELIEELRRTSRRRIGPRSSVYRVSFHFLRAEDERARLAADASLSREDVDALAARLERMDGLSAHGPWTARTLALIAKRPRTAASALASEISMDRLAFKANVRKLKALGLTVSLKTGYRLSPRGRAFLRRTNR